ncbi:MAG: bifunctional UDP-sugar hydrolase/5'-nucleotidase, partial [Halobacteriaceae archaeon]
LTLFDAVSPDVETFGNHDFDYGPERTRELVARSPQTWVAANVVDGNGEPFGADVGVRPWTVVERGDVRVGLFGVLDHRTPALDEAADSLTVTDPYEAAAAAVRDLRAHDVDYLLALSHLGRGDERLAVETGVDAVLGGHVHSERVERMGDGTVLARPGVNGRVLLEVTLDADRIDVTRHEVAAADPDPAVADRLRARRDGAGLDEVVATVADPITRTERTVFRGESRVGNFVADAYRWAADADVGMQNSGGIREGPPLAGEVTVGDLVSVVPFDEPVAVAELSGRDLRETLASAHGATLSFGEADWWHAHVSGATVVRAADGSLDAVRVGGDPVSPDRIYRLATTDFLFTADAEFPALTPAHRVARLDTQYEVLAAYAREEGVDARLEGRIVRRDGPNR